MKQRVQKPLDMLPLLDVMMVILFAFATIQEGQLSDTSEERSAAEIELAQLSSDIERLDELSKRLKNQRDAARDRLEKAEIEEKIQEIENLTAMLQDKLN